MFEDVGHWEIWDSSGLSYCKVSSIQINFVLNFVQESGRDQLLYVITKLPGSFLGPAPRFGFFSMAL